MTTENRVEDNGDARIYFIQIPNMIDDMDLSVYAFRLYVHLKRVAGENGECWQSTRTLAKACRMSVSTVSETKQELINAGLITIREEPSPKGGKYAHTITIVDIWRENMDKYGCSQDEQGYSPHEQRCSPGEIKKNPIKNNPDKNIVVKENGKVFETFQNEIQLLTPHNSNIISGWIDEYPSDWIIDAIHAAVEANIRKPKYIEGILKNWKADGRGDKRKRSRKEIDPAKAAIQRRREKLENGK